MAEDPIVGLSREVIQKGSKSFAMAARLLPRAIRYDAMMLYAWCRHCDDVIDGQELGFSRGGGATTPAAQLLDRLRVKTSEALAGKASDPVFVALGRVAQKHAIPERHPMELLRGFQMDVEGRTYRTLDDTLEYCYHVAGVVGVMMAIIMGVRDQATLHRASDLGIGFQLTNIARDVIADAEAGRLYLPREWLQETGLNGERISDPACRAQLFEVTAKLLREAEAYYRSALYGMSRLPLRAAIGIGAARRIYRDIGSILLSGGPDAWNGRIVARRRRKAAAVLSGAVAALRSQTLLRMQAEPQRVGLWTKPSTGSEKLLQTADERF